MRNLVLVLCLSVSALVLSSCGAAPALGPIVAGAEIVVNGTCAAADKLCEANDPSCGSGACRVFAEACPVLAPSAPVQISCSAHPASAPDAGQ